MKNVRNKLLMLLFLLLLTVSASVAQAEEGEETIREAYDRYRERFEQIHTREDFSDQGFSPIKGQLLWVPLESFGEVLFIPALDHETNRLALFLADREGGIVYKTDQLESNHINRGQLRQPNRGIVASSFRDLDDDGLTDIVLIISCADDSGGPPGESYRTGEVMFQSRGGFYRDWRLSDKINRFSMNQSVDFITQFVRSGRSTEFLYTASTLRELLRNGFEVESEQCYWRQFEKLGRLQVVPGIYAMADYHIFLIYLVNEQGDIVWSLQPMGKYDNLYALKGITCKDIDGDGLKDMVVLARYSYEQDTGESVVVTDYSIYYQRTGGFVEETDYDAVFTCDDSTTMEELVTQARAYWGWGNQND